MDRMITYIAQLFPAAQHRRIFLVGGVVRDLVLGREPVDIDLAAALTAEEFIAAGFRSVAGKTTAPIWFRYDPACGTIEVTPLRDVAELSADLRQRDFTINAMAMTLDGEIIDPLAGRADLVQRRLRACSSGTFSADPVRIFRAFRFEAHGWEIQADAEQQIAEQDWSLAWAAIPMERFSREMLKALAAKEPERFFRRMLELGIGRLYLPELFRMPAVPAGPLIHHPEGDLFTHSVQVLQRVATVSADPLTRFCALFHDLGKLATSPALYPKHHGHDQAGFQMAHEFCQRLRVPAHYGKALSWISRLHGTFNLWDSLRDATKLKVADQAIKAGIVDILPLVAAADKPGGKEPGEWRVVVAMARMTARELGIGLDSLEQRPPSKRAGFIFQARLRYLGALLRAKD
ncbi:MAG: HD domain-containing protein [Geobacteraceae bacterium]|nr:HD domain-containing protein [Geobacteraceae bacterium]